MPIVRSNYQGADGLASLTPEQGGLQKYTHVQQVDEIARECAELRKAPRKRASGDSMQLVARIPELAFFSRPQLVDPTGRINRVELKKYLESPEGELFKATEARI